VATTVFYICIPATAGKHPRGRPRGLGRQIVIGFDLLHWLRSEDEVPAESCAVRVSSLPISGHGRLHSLIVDQAQYELGNRMGSSRSCGSRGLLRPVRRCRTHAAPLETQPLAISTYLDIIRDAAVELGERKNKAIGSSTEFGLKRPRAFLAIRMDAYFMIRSTPSTRSVHSTWCEFSGKNAYRSSLLQGKRLRGQDYFCP